MLAQLEPNVFIQMKDENSLGSQKQVNNETYFS
jgi:hypothetical protein